ncbi:hypothetical protein [Clostridium magnum]|nr:hypothetical protein [Clostridium magnum]
MKSSKFSADSSRRIKGKQLNILPGIGILMLIISQVSKLETMCK